MATCERVVKEPVPPPVEYVLRLSEAEAKVLRQFLYDGKWPGRDGDGGLLLNDIYGSLQLVPR